MPGKDGVLSSVRLTSQLHWRRWGDEWVVYSTASGQTHKLDALTAAVLLCVEDGVADVAAVQAEVLRELGLESGQILTDRIGAIMEQCKTLGLIDSVP